MARSTGPGDALRAEGLQPERGPATRALNAAVEAAAAKVDAGAAAVPPEPPAPGATPPGGAGTLRNENGDLMTAGEVYGPGDTTHPVTGERIPAPTTDPAAAAATPGVNPGVQTAAQVAQSPVNDLATMAAAAAQREADRPPEPTGEVMPGDLLTKAGQPFKSMQLAMKALARAGGEATHELVPVAGGLVIRPKQAADGQPSGNAQPGAADGAAVPGNLGVAEQPPVEPGNQADAGAAVVSPAPGGDAAGIQPGSDGPVPELSDDLPTLKKAWADATAAGDTAGAARINDAIVEAKRKAKATTAPAAPKSEPVNAAAPATDPAGDLSAPAGARTPQEAAAPVTGTDSSELPMGQPAWGEARVVRVNGQEYALTPEQRADMDRVEASFKVRFDAAKATFEATKNNPPTDNPDVGLKSARERYDAEQKALGMQLSAERRRIVGAQTPKEKAAKAELDARVRNGDQVQTPEGLGTVTGNNFGKVRVQVNGQTRTFPRADVTKVEAQAAPAPAPEPAPAAPAEDQKARWLKNVADTNRAAGSTGVQIGGMANGRLNFMGDPNATKQGRQLLATVEEARKAGATDAEIAAAAAPAAPTGERMAPGTRVNGTKEKAAADRLEKLAESFYPQTANSPEGAARQSLRSIAGELRKERTVTSVEAILEQAAQRLDRQFSAQADVVREVLDGLREQSAEPAPDAAAPASTQAPAQAEAPGAAAPAPAPKPTKAEMRPYRRADGSIGYEAVPIIESAATAVPAPAPAAPTPSANTVFTEDAAAAARARLKAKLGPHAVWPGPRNDHGRHHPCRLPHREGRPHVRGLRPRDGGRPGRRREAVPAELVHGRAQRPARCRVQGRNGQGQRRRRP